MWHLPDFLVNLAMALMVSALCSLLFPSVYVSPYVCIDQQFLIALLVFNLSRNKLVFHMGLILNKELSKNKATKIKLSIYTNSPFQK